MLINIVAGVVEIALGTALNFRSLRKAASTGIIFMLLAFVLSHIYFIQIGSCVEGGLCVPEWIGWGRLLLIHPLLMWWAWAARK